ncbi:MAG: SPFH domain-containing protein, partial [Bacteroidota bacterium]
GTYNFRISNYEQFFKELAGTDPIVTLRDVEGTLRGKLVDRFTEIVAEMASNDFSFVQMQANKTEFVEALKPRIKDYFEQFGLDLTDFSIQSITLPPELQEYLRKNTQMNMVGDMQRFNQFQMGVAMEKSAENPGGGNAGVDMGTGMAMGQMMMNQMAQVNQPSNNAAASNASSESADDIMALLEKLGKLKESGVLTEEEFAEKKKDLLSRL